MICPCFDSFRLSYPQSPSLIFYIFFLIHYLIIFALILALIWPVFYQFCSLFYYCNFGLVCNDQIKIHLVIKLNYLRWESWLSRVALKRNNCFLEIAYYHFTKQYLKAVYTIGNCQRLAFTVGVSQHRHKITNLWKFELNRSSNLRDNNDRKNALVTWSCVHLDGWFRDLKF